MNFSVTTVPTKEAARHSLGIDLAGLNARIDKKPDSLTVENAISETLETIMTRVDVIKNELKNEIAKNGVPTGTIAFFAMTAPPAGYLKADGAIIQRTDYPALFTAIGTTFGEGDGTTTFTLPDLRGEFIRGWDNGRNIDCERAFGSIQGDAIRNVTGQLRYAGPQNSDSVMNYQSALQGRVSHKNPHTVPNRARAAITTKSISTPPFSPHGQRKPSPQHCPAGLYQILK